MTGWTLFLTIVGVAFLTAQLFRLIDLIERPSRPLFRPLCRLLWSARASGEKPWMFWKN